MLARMGDAIFGQQDLLAVFYNQQTQQIKKEGDGYLLSIYMPLTAKQDVTLSHKGDELIVRVGLVKRTIILPRTLRSFAVQNAKFDEDRLNITLRGGNGE